MLKSTSLEDPPTIPAVRADIKGLVSRIKVIVGNLTATAGVATGRQFRSSLFALGTCVLWRAVVAVFRSGLCVCLFRCVLGCGFGQSLRQSAIAKPAQCLRFMPSLAPVTSLRSSLRSRHSTQHQARHARLRPVAAFPTLHRPPSAHALPSLQFLLVSTVPVNAEVRIFKDKARPAPFATLRHLTKPT